ncbi:elongation factor 1-gamma 2-like protein [Tanacetum coccineum]
MGIMNFTLIDLKFNSNESKQPRHATWEFKGSGLLGGFLGVQGDGDRLQALSDLYYLFDGFMDYLWSRELEISNFGPENSTSGFLDFAIDNYSLWFYHDKQNDKNERLRATVDKVDAFLLRIDLARGGDTFGKILITGSNVVCKVKGFWILRQAQLIDISS